MLGRVAFSLLTVTAFLLTPPARAELAPRDSGVLVIRHVNVVDVDSGRVLRDRDVIVSGMRITAVDSALPRLPDGARIFDASGRYVIPGLWDMHVHLDDTESWVAHPSEQQKALLLGLLVANGVTGVRDMGSGLEQIRRWQQGIVGGDLLGPTIITAGPIVDGSPPLWLGSVVAATEAEGRRAVASLVRRDVDFIKVYARLTEDAYRGIAAEAATRGITFAGHLPSRVPARLAIQLGQHSIEHLHGLPLACSRDEDRLRTALTEELARAPASDPPLALWGGPEVWMTYDAARCQSLFEEMARRGTWIVPTLRALWGLAHATDSTFIGDPRLRFMPRYSRRYWEFQRRVFLQDSLVVSAMRSYWPHLTAMVALAARTGVGILAGSDLPSPAYDMAGFALHDELALLVEAGLTPREALATATTNPARFLNLTDSYGGVRAGKVADLVILEGNPLEDIKNTQRINSVVVAGRFLPSDERLALLEQIAAAVGR